MKVSQSISPILTPKLVDMAMSLERSQKEGQISNLRSNIYHTVKNLVKIYQVVPQIICLKGFIFLKTRGWVHAHDLQNFQSYWIELHQIFTRCSQIIPFECFEIGLRYSNL